MGQGHVGGGSALNGLSAVGSPPGPAQPLRQKHQQEQQHVGVLQAQFSGGVESVDGGRGLTPHPSSLPPIATRTTAQQAVAASEHLRLQQVLQRMALQQQQQGQGQGQGQGQYSSPHMAASTAMAPHAAAPATPLHTVCTSLMEARLIDPAFFHAATQVDFLPDGHYQQDSVPLEDSARRQEQWNAAVDAYIASGMDPRSPAEICVAAKIGADGGPLHYHCACCVAPLPEHARPLWCPGCHSVPFCGEACGRAAYAQHRAVCGSARTRPLLASQVAVRLGIEAFVVQGMTGAALQASVMQRWNAVQRSYQAARTAAAAVGIVDDFE